MLRGGVVCGSVEGVIGGWGSGGLAVLCGGLWLGLGWLDDAGGLVGGGRAVVGGMGLCLRYACWGKRRGWLCVSPLVAPGGGGGGRRPVYWGGTVRSGAVGGVWNVRGDSVYCVDW